MTPSGDDPPPPAGRDGDGAVPVRDEQLPDIDSLGPDSDYRPFLQRNVAPALRRIALRRLWQSDPVLANLDGLNDYDEDFASLHRAGAEAVAAAVRAGRRYARGPVAPGRDDPPSIEAAEPAGDLPAAEPATGSVDPDNEAPDSPEQPA